MEKKNKRKIIWKIITAFILILVLVGCGNGSDSDRDGEIGSKEDLTIRVGSKDFTEGLILSELYSLALEDAGYNVERMFNLGSPVIHGALTNDEIDMYPEYTGTGLLSVLQLPMESDPEAVYETVKAEYEKQFDLVWLDYSEVNNSQGLVITTEKSEELGIKTISDLQEKASEINFASQGEFDVREDGIPGLEEVYGEFDWNSSAIYDNSLKYQVLSNGEADVAPAYTTEGQLTQDEFTLLEDDRQFWPPYNAAPVIQASLVEKQPEIAEVLNHLSAQLNSENMTELNARVDIEREEYEDVAREFYESLDR